MQDIWHIKDPQNPKYPTEKNIDLLRFIIRQSSHKDSVVLDCFTGSGAKLLVVKLEGRKWLGMDNSEQSLIVIKNRNELKDFNLIKINIE